jgi:hypothetical protein
VTTSTQQAGFAASAWDWARMLVLRRLFPVWFRVGGACHQRWTRPDSLTVVLLSYGRPANLDAIVAACIACPFVGRVILSNNNPAVDIRRFLRHEDPRLEVIWQPMRCYPSKRYELALESEGAWFLCIDDDTFLTPWQIRSLFEALLGDERVPHGIAGEIHRRDGGIDYVFGNPGRPDAADCLVWAFAFTRRHVERYFALLHGLGIVNAELLANEDVVLSLTGEGPALVHYFGTLHLCGSRNAADVATSQQPGFRQQREDLLRTTRAVASSSGA